MGVWQSLWIECFISVRDVTGDRNVQIHILVAFNCGNGAPFKNENKRNIRDALAYFQNNSEFLSGCFWDTF